MNKDLQKEFEEDAIKFTLLIGSIMDNGEKMKQLLEKYRKDGDEKTCNHILKLYKELSRNYIELSATSSNLSKLLILMKKDMEQSFIKY